MFYFVLHINDITYHALFDFSSVTQSCPTLCDSMDCSRPGLPVHQQFPEFTHFMSIESVMACKIFDPIDGSPLGSCLWDSPGKNTGVGCLLFQCMKVKIQSEVAQSCLTLRDSMDCSLPGSSVHGIFQARVLEWVVIPFSRGSSQPRDLTCVSCIGGWILYHLSHLGRQSSPRRF